MSSYTPAYRMTVYVHRSIDATETTVLKPVAGAAHSDDFKVSTIASTGFKLYLGLPDGRRGRIDPLSKKTDVGEIQIGVLDVRAGAVTDNLTRWVTAFLGDSGDLNQLGGCKAAIEESTNGGSSWSAFFTGRIASVKLRGKLWYDFRIRDASETLKADIFVGQPHSTASYAQLFSLLPVGILKPYGVITPTVPLRGTMDHLDTTRNTSHITVSTDMYARIDNRLTVDLWNAIDGFALQGFGPGGADNPQRFTGSARLHLKRLDTSAEGDFLVGSVELAPVQGFHTAAGVTIKPLRYPIGVATGTPLVNNVAGYSVGATSIATDGWTITITGILKQGDIISFASHSTRYFVTADTNSNGSGQATVTINPPLTASVPDNNAISVQQSLGKMALPPNATDVEFSIVRDARLRESSPNCILINDVHPVALWRDILDGYFGQRWNDDDIAAGSTLAAGANLGDPKRKIAYDSTAFSNLIADETFPRFRVPIGQFEASNEFIERAICKPYGLGYYLDGQGRVVPVDLRFPASLGGVVTLTDADLATAPPQNWEFDDTASITSALGTRYAEKFNAGDAYGPIQSVPITESGGASTLVSVPVPSINYPSLGQPLSIEFVYENSRGNLFDDQPYEVDAVGLRAQPNEVVYTAVSTTVISQDRAVWTEQTLKGLMRIPQRPFGRGPATIKVQCRRTSNTNSTFPGTLHLLAFSAIPDPATNLRGGTRAARCLERAEQGLTISFTFLDLGVSTTATAPTLGAPAQVTGETQTAAQIAVTLNASNQGAEIHYAVTPTSTAVKPADSDAVWTPLNNIFQSMTVTARNLPQNSRVWWRARTFDLMGVLMPSAWVYPTPQYVDLATPTAPSSISVTNITSSTAHVSWTIGTSLQQIALSLVTPTTDPLQLIALLPPGTTAFDLSNLAASTGYKVEVAHWLYGGKSGAVSTTFTTTSTAPICPNAGTITIIVG